MPLKFIIGNCGNGKTTECINQITKAEKTAKHIIYIVPQQFTLESEHLLLKRENSHHAIMKTRVLSFKRLNYVLLGQLGSANNDKPVLTPLGRVFIIRKAVYDNSKNLLYYSKVIDKQGFFDNLVNIITELYQYNVTPEMLKNAAESLGNNSLSLKLKDIYTIYSSYRDFVQQYYMSTDEAQNSIISRISDSDYIKNAEIWIDGFEYFTPQEYSIINMIMIYAKNVTIAMNGDFSSLNFGSFNMYDPFYESKKAITKLLEIANECNCKIEDNIFLDKCHRHLNHNDFLHLQQNYFKPLPEKYAEKPNGIQILKACDVESEIRGVCHKILNLVKKGNIRYNNIAIIIGNNDYANFLSNIFTEYDLPIFIDNKKPVSHHPLTELILSILDIVCYGFQYKNIFRYLKNVFSPLEREQVCYLENYVLKYGINSGAWKKAEWNFGFSDKASNKYKQINDAKTLFIDSIKPITDNIKAGKKYTSRTIISALYNCLFTLNIDKKLENIITTSNNENDQNALLLHTRIWSELSNIFETMVEVLGDEQKIDISEFVKLFNAGIKTCTISIIPPTQDNIIVGDIDRSRLPKIKHLFILGVNDGVIPPYVNDIGLFCDSERTKLNSEYFEMSADNLHKLNQLDFLLFSTMLKPENNLYLSYCTLIGGQAAAQSAVITKLIQMFPSISIEDISDSTNYTNDAPEPVFNAMLKSIGNYVEGSTDVPKHFYDSYYWFKNSDNYSHRITTLNAILTEQKCVDYLDVLARERLYGTRLDGSVSKLEHFAQCPFSYFMQYGLKIFERENYEFNSLELGNIFHSVLEDISKNLEKNDTPWQSLERDNIKTLVNDSIDTLIPQKYNDFIIQQPKFIYTLRRIKNVLSQSIWALSNHIKSGLYNSKTGSFKPEEFEVSFGINKALPPIVYQLEDKHEIVLSGKIDRVDIMETLDGKNYVKIIDYKSGHIDNFDINKFFYGLQLQLILYMDSYIKANKAAKGKELLPGGIFYFHVNNPINTKNNEATSIEDLLMSSYKMKGLVLSEESVLSAIGEYMPAKGRKKKASVENLDDSIVFKSAEDFEALCKDAEQITQTLGKEIFDGNVRVLPYKLSDDTGCDYCNYSNICGFNEQATKIYRDNQFGYEGK